MKTGPYKMKAGKEGPMKKNFGISPMKSDKLKKALEKKSDKKLQEIARRQLDAGVRLSDFRNKNDQSAPVDSMRTAYQILKERDTAKKKK